MNEGAFKAKAYRETSFCLKFLSGRENRTGNAVGTVAAHLAGMYGYFP